MPDPWKVTMCDSDPCISEMFEPTEYGSKFSKLNQDTIEKYKIYPEIDTEELTRFTCPRCGKVQKWGPQRQSIAKTLYEKFGNA